MSVSAPKFSVVVPCYNAGKTISRTIASVQAQTETDWELVAIDDGSTDNTLEVLMEVASDDDRIRLVRQQNSGVSAARNLGIQKTQAPIIAFLDSDDFWYPDYMARTLAKLGAQSELGFTFSRVDILDQHGNPTGRQSSFEPGEISLATLLRGNPATTCSNLVVRREVFNQIGMFETKLSHAEDQLWMVMAALKGWKVEGINEVLMGYRTNPGGLSSNLEAMRCGWEVMAHMAWLCAPDKVAPIIDSARADNLFYLGRRSLRLKNGLKQALRYLVQSVLIDPSVFMAKVMSRRTSAKTHMAAATTPGGRA